MTVYVDDMRRRARIGRIDARWSHLVADHSHELHAFAARLGLKWTWIQDPGQPTEHFDVTDRIRAEALALGAQPMSYLREMGPFITAKRQRHNGAKETNR